MRGSFGKGFVSALMVFFAVVAASANAEEPKSQGTSSCDIDFRAVEVVENLWHIATEGGLLTNEGWQQASVLFTHTVNDSKNPKPIFTVMSNRYWVEQASLKDGKIEVAVQSDVVGTIDSNLQYVPPVESQKKPTFYVYDLVFGPTPMRWYAPDGKTLIREEMSDSKQWRIEGSLGQPWTTVNTAIRYVMHVRDTSNDFAVKRNAEHTLLILLKNK